MVREANAYSHFCVNGAVGIGILQHTTTEKPSFRIMKLNANHCCTVTFARQLPYVAKPDAREARYV